MAVIRTQDLSIEEQRRRCVPTAVNNAVHSTWNALAHTVLVENARTLEDLVREMLQPMLRSWLDDNLPTLVERLVLVEIERIAGRKPPEHHERHGSDIIFG
jgi:cell pole-organizing protein PopZ